MESPYRERFDAPKDRRIIIDDLAQYEEGEIGVGKEIKEKRKNRAGFGWLKNLFIFILIVGIVVASFWISYLIGKKMFVPIKPLPSREMPKPAITPEEVLGGKPLQVKEAPAEKPKAEEVKPVVQAGAVRYYKIQAGLFDEQADALSLANKIKNSGFPTYVRKLPDGTWRVQAGAVNTKSQAKTVQNELKGKGFNSTIIFE
ncbi:MAG: SPOR domain-containing protein [Candidatus Saganbacteria bacterium]|nr:SPOR domain-containing protein [Candidatus Saganbacteria bacterium]